MCKIDERNGNVCLLFKNIKIYKFWEIIVKVVVICFLGGK